jgi:hypothetical protein
MTQKTSYRGLTVDSSVVGLTMNVSETFMTVKVRDGK